MMMIEPVAIRVTHTTAHICRSTLKCLMLRHLAFIVATRGWTVNFVAHFLISDIFKYRRKMNDGHACGRDVKVWDGPMKVTATQ